METRSTLSKILKEAREQKGLSVEEVAETVYLPPRYIVIMEEGRWNEFSSLTHLRGYLKLYLMALKLDTGLLKVFSGEEFPFSSDTLDLEEEKFSEESFEEKRENELFFPLPVVIGFLLFSLILVTLPGVVFHVFHARETSLPIESVMCTEEPKECRTITLIALEPVWIRLFADGEVVYEGLCEEGERKECTGTSFFIRAGNAAGMLIESEREKYGPFGSKGSVVDLRIDEHFFTSQGKSLQKEE
ncbi:MAG: RodZ domain-containing protein [Candidatus Ratteibacteria bacterium]|jgi:transcriptional regulator with XRE-family HTH domain